MTTESTTDRPATVGLPLQVAVKDLRLDSQNPRLPETLRGGSQTDLAVVLEMGFDAYAVAQSIADNGYFMGEPVLTIRSETEPGTWVVVEGNRRLTALLGLTDESIRSQFAEPERWEKVAARAAVSRDSLVPIIQHSSREATHVEVARAHMVGKLTWRPYMQARFIAARVAEGKSIAEVAELIGITKSKAADLYRDQAVVAQAQGLGLETSEIEKAFSLLTVAMSNTKLRDHVGAPLGSRLDPMSDPIPADKVPELHELVGWIFGDGENEPKISDSRQTSLLGNVVASDVGLHALRAGANLDEAKQKVAAAGMAPRDRLISRLTTSRNALLAASDDLTTYATDFQVQGLVADVEAIVESLRSAIDEVALDPAIS
jgi:hypothetical protein